MNAASLATTRSTVVVMVAGASVVSGIGMLLFPGPTLSVLAAGAAVAAVLCAGTRYGYHVMLAYFALLILFPTITLRIGGQEIPFALSDLALAVLGAQVLFAPRDDAPAAPHLQSVGRRLLLLNVAIVASLLLMPLAGSGASLLGSSLRYLRFAPALLVFVAAVRFARGRGHFDRLVDLLMVALLVQSLFGVMQFVLQVPLKFDSTPEALQDVYFADGTMMRRAQGTVGESSSLANLAGLGILVALYRLRFRGGRSGLYPLIAIGLGLACLVLTFSRGMTLSVMLGGAVFFMLTRGGRAARVLGVAAVILAALAILNAIDSRYLAHLGDRFQIGVPLGEPTGLDTYLTGRVSAWRRLLDFVTANPQHAVFGIGYKAITHSPLLGGQIFGDNNYLSVLVECGLFGLGALVVLLHGCYRSGVRVLRSTEPWRSGAGALLVAMWVMEASYMLVSDVLTYWRVVPLLFGLHVIAGRVQDDSPSEKTAGAET